MLVVRATIATRVRALRSVEVSHPFGATSADAHLTTIAFRVVHTRIGRRAFRSFSRATRNALSLATGFTRETRFRLFVATRRN